MVTKLWYLVFFITASFINCLTTAIEINLDSLGGQLGFVGDYAGLSPFIQESQSETYNNAMVISNVNDNAILTFQQFATINGTISTYCQLSDSQYILGGNFNSINGTVYNNIVQLDMTSRQLSPLQQGLNGPVRSLYCANGSTVYVGGDFIAPINTNTTSYSGHVALWQNNQWNPVPWKGFNGPVYSIISQQQQQSILFAGQFDSTGDGQFFNQNSSQTINLGTSAVKY
jgi:hypothetical protein